MSSSWIRNALKYALLLAPAAALLALIALVGIGAVVADVLREPARFADAPVIVQKLAKAAYWHTRKHWHTVPECVLFDRDLLYRPRPGSCVFENAEFRTTMHFDAGGARVTTTPGRQPHDGAPRPRLVIVGDSHAMGWGVEDDETFASILAREFGYPAVNLAVSSYATPRELLRLRRDHPLMPGDVLVIQYCDNDLAEGREFARRRALEPYDPADLQALFDYRPAKPDPLPVAGVLLRLIWKDLTGRASADAGGPDPTSAFLEVLAAYPELRDHRTVVVAINGPGLGTHLDAGALAAAGLPLVVPELNREDFLDLDDHMRPRGHRKVAQAIAAQLASPARHAEAAAPR